MSAGRERAPSAPGSDAARNRKQISLALALGSLAALGSLGVGWAAWTASRSALIEARRARSLERAHVIAAVMEAEPTAPGTELERSLLTTGDPLDAETARLALLHYRDLSLRPAGESFYLVASDGRIAAHSTRPELIGREVGSVRFQAADDVPAPERLIDLLRSEGAWSGRCLSPEGEPLLAAFAPARSLDALVAIEIPWSTIDREIARSTLPWSVAFALLAVVVLPASFLILHRAYARADRSRRDVERALRQSEAGMRAAVENLPFDFWMLDAEGRCVMQNSASIQAHGDHVGSTIEDMPIPPEVRERWRRNNARAMAGATLVDPHDEPSANGATRRCHTVISPVREGGRTIGILGINIDVTDLHRAEAAQRGLAERLQILREIDRSMLGKMSLEQICSDLLHQLERLYSFSRISVLIHEGDRARMIAATGSVRGGGPAGQTIWIRDIGYRDLDALRRGELEEVVEIGADARPGTLIARVRANGVLGYLAIPLIAHGELCGTLNIGLPQPGRVDPELREIAVEASQMLALAVLGARRDAQLASQAAELERRVEERTRELRAANEELEEYVRTASHDLRAPLRAIQGFTQALHDDLGGRIEGESRQHLERTIAAAERMDELLLDLLDYSRLGRSDLDLRPVDTSAAVAEARTRVVAELEHAGAEVAVEEPLAPLVAHAPMLVQAVANLLSNAAKFVAPGVVPRIRIATERRGSWVRLAVQDNGIGIAAEHHERIFAVFERLHTADAYPGTGIGLAIVRRAAERMGGRTGVESRPGGGSTFWIELPAAAVAEEAA